MEKKRIAINGFGRIGRLTLRRLLQIEEIEVVAINDLAEAATLAHLFKWDSIHGPYKGDVAFANGKLEIDGHSIEVHAERDPENLPWARLNVHAVVESTGIFRDAHGAGKHLTAGARKVVISAPAKGDVATVVLGVNDNVIAPGINIYSNASCTTNCLAPMVKVLHDKFGVVKGYITTIHAYTADQKLQDGPHKDLRRARAAALNMIPTTTGAASAVGKVITELDGKLDGKAVRVPTPDGSLTDLTAVLEHEVLPEEINAAMHEAASGSMKGILQYSKAELVSTDIIGNPHSCIFDSKMTSANGNLVKIFGWYDNEAGYAARIADFMKRI